MEWRQKEGKDAWHFCANCSLLPTKDYRVSYEKPTTGEGCNQCISKERKENCQPLGEPNG